MGALGAGILAAGLALPFGLGERIAAEPNDGVTSGAPLPESSPAISPEAPGPGVDDPSELATPVPPVDGQGASDSPSSVAAETVPGAPIPAPATPPEPERPGATAAATGPPVELGVLLLDLGGASRVGFGGGGLANAEEQRRIFEGYIAEWNATGGIRGRKIEPVFARFDPLDASSQRRACLALTEDARVFAVLDGSGGFNGASLLCVTEEHRTPFFTGAGLNNTSSEVQRRSAGRLFGLSMRGERMLQNAAIIWDELGLLENRTIGILDSAELGNSRTVDEALVETLRQRGHRVAKRVIFATEASTAASQVPTAVQEMRAAGVDVVINATNGLYTAQFTQQADAQAYRPRYLASDWALNGTDFTAQNNGRGYDRTPLITVFRGNDIGRVPRSAAEKRCEDVYARRLGAPPKRDPSNPNAWVGFAVRCAVLEYFVRSARAAGPTLTHESLAAGVQALGQLEVALFLPGVLRPGKSDLADQYWIQEWRFDCRCHRVVSGPHLAPVR